MPYSYSIRWKSYQASFFILSFFLLSVIFFEPVFPFSRFLVAKTPQALTNHRPSTGLRATGKTRRAGCIETSIYNANELNRTTLLTHLHCLVSQLDLLIKNPG